jgi:hypothetical protein
LHNPPPTGIPTNSLQKPCDFCREILPYKTPDSTKNFKKFWKAKSKILPILAFRSAILDFFRALPVVTIIGGYIT